MSLTWNGINWVRDTSEYSLGNNQRLAITNFDQPSSVPSSFIGYANINGLLYYINGKVWRSVSNNDKVVVAAIGDSITANCCSNTSTTGVTTDGSLLAITSASHGGFNGVSFYLGGSTDDSVNTLYTMGPGTTQASVVAAQPIFGTPKLPPAPGGTITMMKPHVSNDNDWLRMLSELSNGRLIRGLPLGFPGQTTDYISKKVNIVASTYPDYCIELSGSNDIRSGVSAPTILANRIITWNALLLAGIEPIVLAIPPMNNTAYPTICTTPQFYQILAANKLIQEYCISNRLIYVDLFSAMTDPLIAAPGKMINAYSGDGLHPYNAGALAMATTIHNELVALGKLNGTPVKLTSNVSESYAISSTQNQLQQNPVFTVTGGTVTGPATGTTAGSTTVAVVGTPTSVASTLTARTDGFGNDIVLTIIPGATDGGATITGATQSGVLVAGDVVQMFAEISIAGAANLSRLEFNLNLVSGGVTASLTANRVGSTTGTVSQANFTRKFITPRMRIPAATNFNFVLTVNHSGLNAGGTTVKLGRIGIIRNGITTYVDTL